MEKLAISYWNYLKKGSWYSKAFKIKWLLIMPLLYILNSFIYMDLFYIVYFYKSVINDFDYRCTFTFVYIFINGMYYLGHYAKFDIDRIN